MIWSAVNICSTHSATATIVAFASLMWLTSEGLMLIRESLRNISAACNS